MARVTGKPERNRSSPYDLDQSATRSGLHACLTSTAFSLGERQLSLSTRAFPSNEELTSPPDPSTIMSVSKSGTTVILSSLKLAT
jgi:hypothetical protein